jgi:hypothetical protein
MPEKLNYDQEEEIIIVDAYGEVTVADFHNFVQYLSEIIESFNVKGILVDHGKVESLPDFVNIFNMGSQAGQQLDKLKIAFVYPLELEERYNLFRNSGNTRGANIQLFLERDRALNWLKKT